MNSRRVPDILIEQYALGELSPERAAEVERSERFAERIKALREDNTEFQARYPADVYATRIRNQHGAERARTVARRRIRAVRIGALAMPGAAAVLVLGLLLFGGLDVGRDSATGTVAEITRTKGAASITIYRAVGSEARMLQEGDRAAAGDVLQIVYAAADASFGTIVSVDGRGEVTLHYPMQEAEDPRLDTEGAQRLPYAYRLDDAPEFERFHFITAETSFSVKEVLNLVRKQMSAAESLRSGALELPDGLAVTTVTIHKE